MGFQNGKEGGIQDIRARYSGDHGLTWSDQEVQFKLDPAIGGWVGGETLVDQQGEIQFFLLNDAGTGILWAGEGERPAVGGLTERRLDLWHTKTTGKGRQWQQPKCIWKGYTGSLNSVAQLKNGRILLPFSCQTKRGWASRGGGLGEWSFYGRYDSVVIYSDDGGDTWRLSNAVKIVTPDISYAYGAVEPVVIQLKDGRVWMLIRGQTGRFYESFSADGAEWSIPNPSAIINSDSPAGLARLGDGRLFLVWNNCLRFPYAYGGRQVIHAAISEDDGATWRGFREVGRDPLRHQPPPPGGDFGTAYPFPSVTADNRILIMSGQGVGRRSLVILDPDYLYETRQSDDFSAGLEAWSVFGTKGVLLTPHPRQTGRKVLQIRRADVEFPATAVWNFPAGVQGTIRLRLMLTPGFGAGRLALTDHFSVPYDQEDKFYNMFNLPVCLEAPPTGWGAALRAGQWHDVELRWAIGNRECRLLLDNHEAGVCPLRREGSGISYLRLSSLSGKPETGAMLLESVSADVSAGPLVAFNS
ncbi:MAG: exo-alpha-sialidase [Lentisphaerae bacterium]|nr:exo-alpha-sialidase [Lentisphaerota bacterium]